MANASAGTDIATGFEPPTYSLGALAGQDGWTGSLGVVENSTVFAGSQALSFESTGASNNSIVTLSSLDVSGHTVTISDEVRVSAIDPLAGWDAISIFGENGFIAQLAIVGNGAILNGAAFQTFPNVVATNIWQKFELELNFDPGIASALVDGNLLGSDSFLTSNSSVNRIDIGLNTTLGRQTPSLSTISLRWPRFPSPQPGP